MNSGYYFCSFCNDVVNMPFTERYEVCSRCGNRSAVWHLHKVIKPGVTPETARTLFQNIHETIEKHHAPGN